MPLGQISCPMRLPTRIRSPHQSSKRHCIGPHIAAWPKQRNYLWDTGEEAYLCYNRPHSQQQYHRSPCTISDRSSQDGDRLLKISLFQQIPSRIPENKHFMDLPHMVIHAQKSPINRRNYYAPTTAKTEQLIHHGRTDGNGNLRESYVRVKHIQEVP